MLNTGSAAAGPFNVGIYFSRDGKALGSLLSTIAVPGLDAGASKTTAVKLAYPRHQGNYFYLTAVVDNGNQVPESNEDNNTATAKVR